MLNACPGVDSPILPPLQGQGLHLQDLPNGEPRLTAPDDPGACMYYGVHRLTVAVAVCYLC